MAKNKYDVRFNLIEEITENDIKKLIKQVEEINNYLYATNDLRSPYGSRTLRARIGKEVREIIREEINESNKMSYKEFTLWVVMIFGFFSVALFAILWWL